MFYSFNVKVGLRRSIPLAAASGNMVAGWFVLYSRRHTAHPVGSGLVGPSYTFFVAFYVSFDNAFSECWQGLFNKFLTWVDEVTDYHRPRIYDPFYTSIDVSRVCERDQNYRLIKKKLLLRTSFSVRCSHWVYCGEGVTLAVHMSHSGSEKTVYHMESVSLISVTPYSTTTYLSTSLTYISLSGHTRQPLCSLHY